MTTLRATIGIVAFATSLAACGGPEDPAESLVPAYGTPTTTSTIEPVSYSDVPYDFTGPTPIGDLYTLINDQLGGARVWFGTAPTAPYPFSGPCDTFGTTIATVPELPVEIEGIVTLHPRYQLTNVSFCQSRERFYGSYFIEDSTRGILILKDSRIADFTVGDRVKLKVTGLMYTFGSYSVLTSVDEEIVSRGHDLHTEDIGDRNLDVTDVGKTVTVERQLSSDATNYNFSEMCFIPVGGDDFLCTPACLANEQCLGSLLVSLDREIEQRDPKIFKKGDVLRITGPVTNSFGLRILVSRAGQILSVDE